MDKTIVQSVSLERMMGDVRTIAGWERAAGSPEEEKAFLYLEQRLKDMGYLTKLLKHDAYISIPLSGRLTAGGERVDARTHAMSVHTGANPVTGALLYVEDMKLIPEDAVFADKIILTNGRAVYASVHRAEQAGAAGIICIQESPVRECIPSAAWGSPTPDSRQYLPSIPVLSVCEEDGRALLDRMRDTTLTAEIETHLDTGWKKIPLLTGELCALNENKQFVMFSGHVDSWYYGAIDNGTANAVQLETARLAAEHKAAFKRNLRIVFFSGHSQGRYAGSAWYADNAWEDLHENCVVNINADSLGGQGASDITRSIIMPETKALAAQIIKERTGAEFLGSRCQRSADQSFWPAGISSAFASFSKQERIRMPDGTLKYEKGNAELGWWWHTPHDLPENVDPDNLRRDAGIFAEYTLQFLTRPLLPLNYAATMEEITQELKNWQKKAGTVADLQDAITVSEQLTAECKRFYATDISQDKKNRIILKLGRILVPLNYTTGRLYENDPALSYPPVPSLSVIDKLLSLPPQSGEFKEWMIVFMRKKNYVKDSLIRAREILEGDT